MNNRYQWIKGKIRLGWLLLIAGALVITIGIFTELQFANMSYNFRIITGLGIVLVGSGIGYLVRYRLWLKNEQAAKRLAIEEQDERTALINSRAGRRAYWVSAALAYIGLLWASFAANGSLPPLSGNTLWYFMATCVLIPFGVYMTSILVDQRNT